MTWFHSNSRKELKQNQPLYLCLDKSVDYIFCFHCIQEFVIVLDKHVQNLRRPANYTHIFVNNILMLVQILFCCVITEQYSICNFTHSANKNNIIPFWTLHDHRKKQTQINILNKCVKCLSKTTTQLYKEQMKTFTKKYIKLVC